MFTQSNVKVEGPATTCIAIITQAWIPVVFLFSSLQAYCAVEMKTQSMIVAQFLDMSNCLEYV